MALSTLHTRGLKPKAAVADGDSEPPPPPTRDGAHKASFLFEATWSAPHLFGDRVDDFAGEMRELLRSRSPDGVFWDWPGDTEIVLVRRRAG